MLIRRLDPDGITSTYIMVDYLKKCGANIDFVYHERSLGHGVQNSDVPNDTDLLIILDSSSNEVEECKKLSNSMDIIIIDHHIIDKENPYVLLVNQQQECCEYPNKGVCTALLVHKFVELMDYNYKKINAHDYIDLVGLALLADSMPMNTLENRYYVGKGLEKINNVGLLALIKSRRLDENNLDTSTLNFQVIPLINSVARMDQLKIAFDLLFEEDYSKARHIANKMIKLNEERRSILSDLTKHAHEIMKEEKFIIVISDRTTKNFNGLVAQQLATEFKKPVLVLEESSYAGSFRSYDGINLLDILNDCPYVEFVAGHPEAGGLQILPENMDAFIDYINTELNHLTFESSIIYDIDIDERDMDWDTVNEIIKFDKIHGINSPQVRVRINNILVGDRKLFPQSQKHVKIVAHEMDLLKFNDKDYAQEVDAFDEIDAVGVLSINEFMGNKRINLIMDDYKLCQ